MAGFPPDPHHAVGKRCRTIHQEHEGYYRVRFYLGEQLYRLDREGTTERIFARLGELIDLA